VGVINGGTAMNIVSRHCEFVWDVRNIPGDDPDTLIGEFEKYCEEEVLPEMRQRWSECFIQTEVIARAPEFSPKGSAALELVQAITGTQDTSRGAYVAEAGQFQAAGFPTVMCGPGSIDQAHQPDEFISLEQVAQGESFLRRLIQDLST
jgi:acetylornithine deacetylase